MRACSSVYVCFKGTNVAAAVSARKNRANKYTGKRAAPDNSKRVSAKRRKIKNKKSNKGNTKSHEKRSKYKSNQNYVIKETKNRAFKGEKRFK